MKEAIGKIVFNYEVDCPHCGETNYSGTDQFDKLEHGDGTPFGVLKCFECENEFYLTIE